MKSWILGAGVVLAASLLLPSAARAVGSVMSINGSTTTVEAASSLPVRESGSFTVTPGTGTWDVTGSTVVVIPYQQYVSTDSRIKVDSMPAGAIWSRLKKKFSVDTGAISMGSSAETPAFLLVNLSTNTVIAYIDEVRLSPRVTTNATPNSIVYRCYLNTVVTSSGTAQQVLPCNTSAALNSNQVRAFTLPTAPDKGIQYDTVVVQGSSMRIPMDGKMVMTPGSKILVTAETGLLASQASIFVSWWEE
jgi:hypothetical protein